MGLSTASASHTIGESIGIAIRNSLLGESRVTWLLIRADGATAKVTRTTWGPHGEKRQELNRQAEIVTEALAALDAAGLCDAADYAPESMEFLDGEIIEIEARRGNGPYTRV